MKRFSLFQLVMLLVSALCTAHVAAQTSTIPNELVSYPETIVINGKIVTMDNTDILSSDPGSIVQAMVIRDEKIFALGSNQEMMRFAGPDTRIIDVHGKTVIPGIIETHVHPESTMNSVRLYESERDAYSLIPGWHTAILLPSNNPEDTYAAIQQVLQEHPPRPGEWVHIQLLENEETDYPDLGSMTRGIYEGFLTMEGLTKVTPNNPATLASGGGPSAIEQPGLVVRVTVGPDGKAQTEALAIPESAMKVLPDESRLAQNPDNPFQELFNETAERRRHDDLAYHTEEGCGWAELYPHHMQHCSHNVFMINQRAMDITLEAWPTFKQAANDVTGLSRIGGEGDRGLIGGVFQENTAWIRVVFPDRIPQSLYRTMMYEGLKLYPRAGVTMLASSAELGRSLAATYDILRRDNRLPVRWGYGFEMFRSPLLYPIQPILVKEFGALVSTPKANPWFWPMGITDGGAGDSRTVACFGEDLPGPEILKFRELCWERDAFRLQKVLIPAIANGWRPFSIHAFGSESFRMHVEWIEQARQAGNMSMDDIRALRIGFAHGGAVGKIPDVIELMIRYNLYVPINPGDVASSVTQVKRYGPEGLEFLAPTKTLLEAGVMVVGEMGGTRPDTYFHAFDMFVNRRIGGEGQLQQVEVVMPEEAVSRATALRLYTSRAAEWLFAEDVAGTLEPGKLADFTVFDQDYFTVAQDMIPENKVIMTVTGDMIMYQDPEWQPAISSAANTSTRNVSAAR